MAATPRGPDLALLRELGDISDRIRALRASDAGRHSAVVKALETEYRLKWAALRAQRAAPQAGDPGPHNRRALYN